VATAEPEQKASRSWKANVLAGSEQQQPAPLPRVFLLHPRRSLLTLRRGGLRLLVLAPCRPYHQGDGADSRDTVFAAQGWQAMLTAAGLPQRDAANRNGSLFQRKRWWFASPRKWVSILAQPREAHAGFAKTSEKRRDGD